MKKISISILLLLAYASHVIAQVNPKVIISEIMYDTPLNEQIAIGQPYSNGEYIELYNMGNSSVNLNGWTLRGGGVTEIYSFPENAVIAPSQHKIIAYRHYDTGFLFEDLYHGLDDRDYYENTFYQRKIILSNSGEAVYLIDNNGLVRDSMYYDGTSSKTKPNRLSADNKDGTPGMLCVSLQRILAKFDENGRAIFDPLHWKTAFVTPYDNQEDWIRGEGSASSGGNYIAVRKYTEESMRDYVDKVQYYDGLGYLEEESFREKLSGRKPLISLYEYDLADRESKKWLPIAAESSDYITPQRYKMAAVSADNYNDSAPYSEIIYESASSDKISQEYNVGQVFRNANKRKTYSYNGNKDSDNVMQFTIEFCDTVVTRLNNYQEGDLRKFRVTNEDGSTTITFIDQFDRTVLVRNTLPMQTDTYYVYDNAGQLRLVISPQGALNFSGSRTTFFPSSYDVQKFCYYYRYDKYGKLFEKQLPGKDREYFIYRGDLLQLWQDGNMRKSDQWIYTMYDENRRICGQEIVKSNMSPPTLLDGINTSYGENAQRPRYKNDFVWRNTELITDLSQIKYNDKFWQLSDSDLQFQPKEGIVARGDVFDLRDAPIYEKRQVLNSTDFIEKAFYYNKKGHLIQTVTKNRLGGIDRISFAYDFSGNLSCSLEEVQPGENASVHTKLIKHSYDYDRLEETLTLIDGEDYGTITSYAYDDLGRVIRKHNAHERYDCNIVNNYSYNIQGWETSRSNDYMDINLQYYDAAANVRNPGYTGNICQAVRKHKDPVNPNLYPEYLHTYKYDQLSRLKTIENYTNGGAVSAGYNENFTYDHNGNIISLGRYGLNGLDAEYYCAREGNQLYELEDFRPNGDLIYSYEYDQNGNMIFDGRRNFDIDYNYLNLVQNVHQNGSTKANYRYLSDGSKLSVTDADGNGYEYLGSFVFKRRGAALTFESTPFDGGRLVPVSDPRMKAMPYFHLTDHLGSVRVVVDGVGNVRERNDYYAFGKRWEDSSNPISDNRHLFNGKELQVAGDVNWLDFRARMYDDELGLWLMHDPASELYYSTSPYAYVRNNPIRRIDTNGMWDDDYRMDEEGRIKLIKNTNDKFDTLTAKDGNGKDQTIRVYDRDILPSLEKEGVNGYKGSFADTGNKYDAFKVFLMGAKYSNVEWSLNGFRTQAGNRYVISTEHEINGIRAYRGNYNELNQVFDIHSHPGANGTKGGSGYYNKSGMMEGDESFIYNRYHRFLNAGMTSPYTWFRSNSGNTIFPPHYVYHQATSVLYQYTVWERGNYIRTINSSSDLYRNMGF